MLASTPAEPILQALRRELERAKIILELILSKAPRKDETISYELTPAIHFDLDGIYSQLQLARRIIEESDDLDPRIREVALNVIYEFFKFLRQGFREQHFTPRNISDMIYIIERAIKVTSSSK